MSSTAASSSSEDDIYSLQARITQLQSSVRQLKKDGAAADLIAAEVEKLTSARAQLSALSASAVSKEPPFNRKAFDELILRKMYVVQSFEIHNGPAGLFDYGPPACALKANVLSLWRRHFVLEENMLEMECTNLTPSVVLETSGHVERFTDFMVKDSVSGDCFRADKLLEDVIDAFLAKHPELSVEEQERHRIVQRQAGAMDAEALHRYLNEYNVKSPTNPNHDLTKPFAFNLMFKTTIGPEGTAVGFLRPETAQGLFVNFRRLLDYNQQRMPFAAAQIGTGFRNEIAPRNGLLRVREFCMAEIEHFVHPEQKQHPRFKEVENVELCLFPREQQLSTGRTVSMTIGDAVRQGLVANETLGYFMARTFLFASKIGLSPNKLRFRQHLSTEMSHYASDCWDLEIHVSYGWVEVVGHADRACYDLTQHSNKTNTSLSASQRLSEPVTVTRRVAVPNKKKIGPVFKTQQGDVVSSLESLSDEETLSLERELTERGTATVVSKQTNASFSLSADLVSFSTETKTVSETKYTPSVIEPSFGIGRLLYALLEHSFGQREKDAQRCVMKFPPCVAPIKVGVYRLQSNVAFDTVTERLQRELQRDYDLSVRVDNSSGSVGRRYSRSDELGIPFGVTVDFQTLIDETVTLRERDSMEQVRVSLSQLGDLLSLLVKERVTWAHVRQRHRLVTVNEDDEEADKREKEEKREDRDRERTVIEQTPRAAFSRPSAL